MADSASLREYKRFIDRLVALAPSVTAARIKRGVWHPQPPRDQRKYNDLLKGLNLKQRRLIAELVQHAADGAIHDVLVAMTEEEYRLSKQKAVLAWEPFGTEMYYDFVCRKAGDAWPKC